MARPLAPDYGQQFLLPQALEDWVPPDHPARFLREFVEQLDLSGLGFSVADSSEGRPPYAPSLLLKIWLFGYMHRIRSTRKLEVACREQLSLLWLCGLLQPDHNSLWRFWRDHKAALRALFKQSAQLAVQAGLVGFVLQAVDGTKIQSASSRHTAWNKESLQKLLSALDRELDETEAQLSREEQLPAGSSYRLPQELTDAQALREQVRAGLQQMEQAQRDHLHPHEPEARRMQCEGKNQFAYNAQAVVDAKAGVIVAAEVTNHENDAGLAVPMIRQAEHNCGGSAQTTVADGGYGHGVDIAQAVREQVNLLVRPAGDAVAARKRFHAYNFSYDPQEDRVRCPEGKDLPFARNMKQKGQVVRIYRCDHHDCPVRSQCTKDQRQRRFVEIWAHTLAVQHMRERIKDSQARDQLRKRSQIIERVFGHVKQQEGWRRWTVRGLEAVQTQWALVCCAFNLRILHRHWKRCLT
jgi:transposase